MYPVATRPNCTPCDVS